MAKFRKKPVVVEATQWFNNGDHPQVTQGFKREDGRVADARGTGLWGKHEPRTDAFVIRTLEGWHEVTPGDWIIHGVKGEFYPCKPNIFAATYEPADPGAKEQP